MQDIFILKANEKGLALRFHGSYKESTFICPIHDNITGNFFENYKANDKISV